MTFTTLQVADGYADHAYWGRPEQMTMFRPSFSIAEGNPGSDLAGETSAAMAAGSLIFRETGKCTIYGTNLAIKAKTITHKRAIINSYLYYL